jgi:hypothetical protein
LRIPLAEPHGRQQLRQVTLAVDMPPRDLDEPARQVFAILIEGIWFAQDSPLEEAGFELTVPP